MIAVNSSFRNHIFISDHSLKNNMRLIDWKRGSPYIFTKEDYEELSNSECMFARKFDIMLDAEIIKRIFNNLMEQNYDLPD